MSRQSQNLTHWTRFGGRSTLSNHHSSKECLTKGQKGSDASETLLGTAGNDLIESGGGNDTIHGGAGYDTAFIAKAISGHTVVVGQDGLALLDRAGGRHSLFDIESIRFSDQSIDTAILNTANLASASELTSITDSMFRRLIELRTQWVSSTGLVA